MEEPLNSLSRQELDRLLESVRAQPPLFPPAAAGSARVLHRMNPALTRQRRPASPACSSSAARPPGSFLGRCCSP